MPLLSLAMVSIQRGSDGDVRAVLGEAQRIAPSIVSLPIRQGGLDVKPALGAHRDEWERAAFLYGAPQGQLEAMGLRRDVADETFLAPLLERARRVLGDAAFAGAEMRGPATGYAEALVAARRWFVSISGRAVSD